VREDGAEGREQLRDHRRRGGALGDAGGDELARGLREAGGEARRAEHGDAGEEDPLAPEQVAEAAGDDQQRGEGEHVGRDHPLELARARPEVRADRGQRDVDDRHVDQVHRDGGDHHHGGEPAPRSGGGVGAAAVAGGTRGAFV
jgi:hypothetical protein